MRHVGFGGKTHLLKPAPEEERRLFAASSSATSPMRGRKTFGANGGGEALLAEGVTGIRGEAERGFPAVIEVALPCLRKLLSDGAALNDALAETLLLLMTATEDTNILARGGGRGSGASAKRPATRSPSEACARRKGCAPSGRWKSCSLHLVSAPEARRICWR